jgi:hypothetical protein
MIQSCHELAAMREKDALPKETRVQKNNDAQNGLAEGVVEAKAETRVVGDPEEAKLIRRLQMMMNLVMQTVAQDGSLTIDEASQMIADARTAALAMFPGKELAYDLIWRPRFQRLMRERFRIM